MDRTEKGKTQTLNEKTKFNPIAMPMIGSKWVGLNVILHCLSPLNPPIYKLWQIFPLPWHLSLLPLCLSCFSRAVKDFLFYFLVASATEIHLLHVAEKEEISD